ncbi:MAG: hypothetical protein ACR2HJ_05890 [Fimbriimonadales bacterium]
MATPYVDDALLDEQGMAHVACGCGAEVLIQILMPHEGGALSGLATIRTALSALVIWLVILGMVLLLVPVYQRSDNVEPAPTPIKLV